MECDTLTKEKVNKNPLWQTSNKERKSYQNVFEGHRQSIIEDEIKTDKILKDILKTVEAYRLNFSVYSNNKFIQFILLLQIYIIKGI